MTLSHWECFTAIMEFCGRYISHQAMQNVQTIMQEEHFPTSMRARTIISWVPLRELQCRGLIPRFLSNPTDCKIRKDADLQPEFCNDPGNMNLDIAFYMLCGWEFMTTISLPDALRLSWQEYGSRGKRSTKGAMNLRGNVLEALLGSYHERMLQLGGSYDAGR